MLMLLLVLMLMLIGMLMRRLMLNLTLELMSKCVLMLMVMLMVMLSWVGGGGDVHFFRRGGHRMRQQARNLRLLQAGGGSRDEGDSLQPALQHHCFDHRPFFAGPGSATCSGLYIVGPDCLTCQGWTTRGLYIAGPEPGIVPTADPDPIRQRLA